MELILSTPQDLKEIVKAALAEFKAEYDQKAEQKPEVHDQLFTIDQAAEFLSITKPTVYSLVSRGDLPVMKRSKRLYFSKDELTNYLKQGRKKTNSEIEAEAVHLLNRKSGRA